MFVAQQKRQENISEYILYMFQIEDIIRALDGDQQKIKDYVLQHYQGSEEDLTNVQMWYLNMSEEMHDHQLLHHGHLPSIVTLLNELNEIHQKLLKQPIQSIYSSLYYKTLPSIIQLRSLGRNTLDQNEIETCYVGIYGYINLKIQGKEISAETLEAIKQISTFLALLADRYCEIEAGNIKL